MWAAACRILQINNILQVQGDVNSFLISICCERNGRSFQFGFGKTDCAKPDVGANIVVTTQKHIHYMPFFHPAVSYIQRKLWVYEKYRKNYYRIIARLLKSEKKGGIFYLIIIFFLCP